MNTAQTKTKDKVMAMPIRWLCVLLVVLTFGVYANTLWNGYTLYDNGTAVNNAMVAKGMAGIPELLTTSGLTEVINSTSKCYRPVPLVLYAVEQATFGSSPVVAHFFNVLFYAACVVMLFLFLHQLLDGKRLVVAFVAALIFLLHPVHTEVVANIRSSDEILSFFFTFLAVLLYGSFFKRGNWLVFGAATASFFLAYLSNETAVTFLFILPGMFFFFRRGNVARASFITGGALVASLAFFIIRYRVLGVHSMTVGVPDFMDNALVSVSVLTRMCTGFYVMGKYMLLLVLPYPLSCDYSYSVIPFAGVLSIGVLLSFIVYKTIGYSGLRYSLKQHDDAWGFAIVYYMGTIGLFSNIPFLADCIMSERVLFFPSVGFCLFVALAADKWLLAQESSVAEGLRSRKVLALLLPLCVAYAGLSVARNADWKDNYTLLKQDVKKQPENGRLNYYLGKELVVEEYKKAATDRERQQCLNEGVTYLKKAVAIYPKYVEAYTLMGTAFAASGKRDSAEVCFKKAAEVDSVGLTAASK